MRALMKKTAGLVLSLGIAATIGGCDTLSTRTHQRRTVEYDYNGDYAGEVVEEEISQPSTLDTLQQGVEIIDGVQDIRIQEKHIRHYR